MFVVVVDAAVTLEYFADVLHLTDYLFRPSLFVCFSCDSVLYTSASDLMTSRVYRFHVCSEITDCSNERTSSFVCQ